MIEYVAGGALAVWLLSRRKAETKRPTLEEPEAKAGDGKNVNVPGLIGAGVGLVVGAGKIASKVGFGGGIVAAATAVGGVWLVVGSWAILAIGSAIVSAIIAPEMDTRATWPKLFSTAEGSLAWRSARTMWANLLAIRLSGGPWTMESQRYPPLDTEYGQLKVHGYLDYLVSPRAHGGRPTDPYDFYGFLDWFRLRRVEVLSESDGALVWRAQQIARAYGTGLACGAAAAAQVSAQDASYGSVARPPTIGSLTVDGLGIMAPEGGERQMMMPGDSVPAAELCAAYLAGAIEGVVTSARIAKREGGAPYLEKGKHEFAIAARIAEWGDTWGRLTSNGAVIEGEGNRVEVSFTELRVQERAKPESLTPEKPKEQTPAQEVPVSAEGKKALDVAATGRLVW